MMRAATARAWGLALTFAGCLGTSIPAADAQVAAPVDLHVVGIDETSARLTWSPPRGATHVVGYRLYERVKVNQFYRRWVMRIDAMAAQQTELTGLVPGSTYEYALSALGEAGNESPPSHPVRITTMRPPVLYRAFDTRGNATVGEPFREQIDALGHPRPVLSLVRAPAAMTIDPLSGMLEWLPPAGGEGSVDVVVQAVNSVGEDRLDFRIKVHPAGTDREAPSRVGPPRPTRITHRGATLTWLPATDDKGVSGYRLFAQAAGRGNSLIQIDDVPAPVTTHEITTLTPGTRYRIWVAGYDAAGNIGPISGVPPLTLRTCRPGCRRRKERHEGATSAHSSPRAPWHGGPRHLCCRPQFVWFVPIEKAQSAVGTAIACRPTDPGVRC